MGHIRSRFGDNNIKMNIMYKFAYIAITVNTVYRKQIKKLLKINLNTLISPLFSPLYGRK